MIAKIFFLLNVFVIITAVIQLPNAWKRRDLPAVWPLLILIFFIGINSFIHAINFLFDYQFDAILIEKLLTSISIVTMVAWVWTMVEFVLQKHFKQRSIFIIYPLILLFFLLTNDYHSLFYTEASELTKNGIPRGVFNFGPIRKIHALNMSIIWVGTTIWGINRYFKNPKGSNSWVFIILSFAIIGSIERAMYISGHFPFTFSPVLSILIAIAGIRHYRLLDLLPLARKQVVETLGDGIAIINQNKEIVDFNQSFRELLEMDLAVVEPFTSIGDLPLGFNNVIDKTESKAKNKRIVNLGDKSIECTFQPLFDKDRPVGHTIVIRNVTEEANLIKQKEFYTQQLEKSKTELEQLDKMKSNFFSNITHEFRTPLTLIAEPARQLTVHPDSKVRSNAKLISNNSRRLLDLVNQLLSLTKLDSGKMKTNLQYGNLAELIRDEYQKFLPEVERRGMQIKLTIQKDFPQLLFDKIKFQSILNNLISNAIKYSDHGIININVSTKATDHYLLSVTDQGRGVSAEDIGAIFDRFYQVDSSDTRRGEGSGIGLALTQQLVQLMNGTIHVESKLGVGSTFTVVLPLLRDKSLSAHSSPINEVSLESTHYEISTLDPSTESSESSEISNIPTEKQIVLVVEDNAELRQFIKSGLQETYQVIDMPNGKQGLLSARSIMPDIIISDVMMPEMDGVEMLQAIKDDELTAHIPVILLTAKSAIEDRLLGFTHGADDYITKPFRLDELIIRSQNIIINRHRSVQRYVSQYPELHEPPIPATSPVDDFIVQLLRTIESEMGNENISADEYAQKMNMSRTHLHRKIKSLTDQSTTEFIRNYRLKRAMTMLRAKEGTVAHIAAKVGFGNDKNFTTS